MFRDILVVLGVDGVAASYALTFAGHFDAEVTAVRPMRSSPLEAVASAQIRYDLQVSEEAAEEEAVAELLREFVEQAHELHVKASVISTELHQRGEPQNLPHFARTYDLVIVEQPTPEHRVFAGGRIGTMLSECGRPVLAVPYIQDKPASFDKVVVAWDASASAARALANAIPVLRRAKSVEVVTISKGEPDQHSPGGAEVLRHLRRHEVSATFREIPAGIGAAEMLLSYIADQGADLMVTGAYGHSRLAETVVGGATRTFLDSMTIPLLMSH